MLIGNILLDEDKVISLIADIKKRRSLRDMNDDFIREQLFNYLHKSNRKLTNDLHGNFHNKSAIYKKVLKDVRNHLRRVYSLFRVEEEIKNRKELVEVSPEQTSNPKNHLRIVTKILSSHSSTKERLPFYKQLYHKIFAVTGKPSSIIDLGCGVNPFSIFFMNLHKLDYYAYDLSEDEISLLNTYFSLLSKENASFKGSAAVLDILHWQEIARHDSVDLCLMFKMTDVLDQGKGHKVSERIIKIIPARYIVVSFPIKTMSGKRMNFPRRTWIELMCKRLGYTFTPMTHINEIFYVIKKSTVEETSRKRIEKKKALKESTTL